MFHKPRSNIKRQQSIPGLKKTGLWILLMGLLSSGAGAAANTKLLNPTRYKFQHYTVDDGLPENSVRVMIQDYLGFLWLGTQNGLVKYDGYQFTVYKPDPKKDNSISDRQIFSLIEDHQGDLWFGTSVGGLNRFDRKTDRFIQYRHSPDDSTTISSNFVRYVYEDGLGYIWIITAENNLDKLDPNTGKVIRYRYDPEDPNTLSSDTLTAYWGFGNLHFVPFFESRSKPGQIWVGTVQGLNRYDPETDAFKRFQHDPRNPNSLSRNYVSGIFEDENGTLWITTWGGGLNRMNPISETFTHYRHDYKNARSLNSDYLLFIYQDSSGKFWLGSNEGLNLFDPEKQVCRHFDDPGSVGNDFAYVLFEDSKGIIWFNSYGGMLKLFLPDSEVFTQLYFEPDNPDGIRGDYFTCIFEDKTGILWIGTMGQGLNKLNRNLPNFDCLRHDPQNSNSLSNNVISALYESPADTGVIWICTNDGLNRYNLKTGRFKRYTSDPKNRNSLAHNSIFSICDSKTLPECLWIGTLNGMSLFNKRTGRFRNYRHSPNDSLSLSSNSIFRVHEDRSGRLWVGTLNRGLNLLEKNSHSFIRFVHDENDPRSISHDEIRCIYEDKFGTIWIGTDEEGLNRYNEEHKNFTPYLQNECIIAIFEDSAGRFWVGTYQSGLYLFDRETGDFVPFNTSDGLPNDAVTAIIEDDNGFLWLSTHNGLSQFDPESKTFSNFDRKKGLPCNRFSLTGLKCSNGQICFGTENGLISFFPTDIIKNMVPPQTVITDFRIFGESIPIGENSILRRHINVAQEITLAHWQNDLSFQVAALHFSLPEDNQYKLKLDNYDEKWRYAGNRRSITYTNLDPGEYFFRAIGSNSDRIWDERGASLRIFIKRPWWGMPWAYTLYFLAGCGILYGLLAFERSRERQKALFREAELRAKASEAQTRAIQVEHERKTKELQEARKLQLSMLPKELPQVASLDISVYMKPATEVGGDYYDFHLADDGTLTIAIGDATGHGMKAGIMVASIKSLFSDLTPQTQITDFFKKSTRIISRMNLGNLYMALMLLRIQNYKLVASSAGMPPILIYRKQTQTVEEIVIKGLPLGGKMDFNYIQIETVLLPGDTILLFSDGFPELFNDKKEILDYPSVKEIFGKVAKSSPKDIIAHLNAFGEKWKNNSPQNDDITFIAIKVKKI